MNQSPTALGVVLEVAFVVENAVVAVVHVVVTAVRVRELADVKFYLQLVVHLDLVERVHEGHHLLLGDRQVGVEAGVGADTELPLSVAMVVDVAGHLEGVVQVGLGKDLVNHALALVGVAGLVRHKRHTEGLAAFLRDDALVVDQKHHVANPQCPRAAAQEVVAVNAVVGEADGENGLAVLEKGALDDGVVLDCVAWHLVDVHRTTTAHIRANRVPEANGVAPDDHGPDVHALNALVVGAEGVFGDEGDFGVVVEFHVEG